MNERPIGPKTKILAGIVATALAFSFAPPVSAAPPAPTSNPPAKTDLMAAKRHYADGERKFKAGDFPGALVEFQAANEIKGTPQAERYIGLCEDSAGHLSDAASWYDKFLEHVPEKMAVQGDEIRKRVAEIKSLPGKVHVESNPPGASVSVDGKALTAPTPTDTELLPGAHTVHLSAPGRLPADKQIAVAFASAQTVSAELEAEPPPPAPPAPPPPPVAVEALPPAPPPPAEPRSKVPAFVTGGLAIAAAGVGTVFGVMALNDKSDFDKNPTTKTADNGDTHALIADMAFGVALTFGVTSAVLFLSKDEQPGPAPERPVAGEGAPASRSRTASRAPASPEKKGLRAIPTPWVGPRSAGAGFVLRF